LATRRVREREERDLPEVERFLAEGERGIDLRDELVLEKYLG
jgi:hypothetical protein